MTFPGFLSGFVNVDGFSLKQVEEIVIMAAWERYGGNTWTMARKLKLSRRTLLKKLQRYGLRRMDNKPHKVTDVDLALAFRQHRRLICAELKCSDAMFVRWLNKAAPFEPDDDI